MYLLRNVEGKKESVPRNILKEGGGRLIYVPTQECRGKKESVPRNILMKGGGRLIYVPTQECRGKEGICTPEYFKGWRG
jgi:hypothetical protein